MSAREIIAAERKRREAERAMAAYQATLPEDKWARLRALGQGASLSFGDEATSAVTALLGKATGDKRGFGEIYRDVLDAEQLKMEDYRAKHPGESLGIELTGGVATGGLSLARTLGTEAVKKLPMAVQRLLRTGVVAGESALAGAGAATPDNRMEGAGWGVATGLGTAGVLKAAGAGYRQIPKRTVAQELGSGENFIPLNVADEGWRGWSMRDFLGRTVGGEEVIRGQTDRVAQRSAAEVGRLQEKLDALPRRFAAMKDTISERIKQEAARRAASRRTAMEAARERAASIKASVPHVAPEQVAEPSFDSVRKKMVQDSLPAEADDIRDEVAGLSALEANDRVKAWWQQNGFADVKNREFAWNDELVTQLEKRVKENPALVLELGAVGDRIVANAGKLDVQKGELIGGAELMALRNVFARPSNDTRQMFKRGALREVVDAFDTAITGQLDKDAAARFQAQKEAYKRSAILNRSVDKAFERRAGEFTPEQALSAEKRVIGAKSDTPYGPAARAQQDATRAAQEAQQQANARAAAEQHELTNAARRQSAGVLREARAARDAQAQADAMDLRQREQRAVSGLREDSHKAKAQQGLEKAKERVARIAALAPSPNQSGLSKFFTTAMLGGIPMGALGLATGNPVTGTLVGVAAGSKIAKALASEGSQRFLAGQTAWQKRLAEQLRNREKEMEQLYRAGYRGAASYGAED